MKGFKTSNEYAKEIDAGVYEQTPKTVLAALLISYIRRCDGEEIDFTQEILNEWEILHLNGIVSQKPPKR